MFNSGNCMSVPVVTSLDGNNDGWGNGNGFIWLILILAILWGGFGGGYGFGGGRSGGQTTSVYEGYVLNNDFSQLSKQISDTYNMTDRKFEGIANGICSLGYDQLAQMNGINTNIMQGTNTLQGAIKDCCCQTQQNIKDTQYVVSNTGNAIQNQIQSCCCDVERQIERGFADTNYAMATQNCATLQAIEKVGDRIIDRLTQDKLDTLRDENASLRLAASQSAQNQYLIHQLRPAPYPAYVVPNPYCNCNNGCGTCA